MKRGFLNDKSKERNGLGALQDLRSQPFWFRDRVGSVNASTNGWGSSTSNWGSSAAKRSSSSPSSWSSVSGAKTNLQSNKQDIAWIKMSEPAQSSKQQEADCDEEPTQSISATTISSGSLFSSFPDSAIKEQASPATSSYSNPFLGQPLLPNKTMGVPKAALQGWYGQRPERYQVSKDQYVSWNDGGMPHNLKFTCLFICPLTGEAFASGRYGSDLYEVRADEKTGVDVVWYRKKANAEHGAAARAYDCFSYRQYFGTSTRSVHLGEETPHLEARQAHRDTTRGSAAALPSFPTGLEIKVAQLQQQARERGKVHEWNEGVNLKMAEQEQSEAQVEAMETEDYRRARAHTTATADQSTPPKGSMPVSNDDREEDEGSQIANA